MKITVDPDRCTGHGRCYTVAADLLTYDDEGYVTIRDQEIDVPADAVGAAREAVMSCPEQAVRFVDP